MMLRWWRRLGYGAKWLVLISILLGIYTVWWWADSARCGQQDEYSYHGICLMQIKERAERGDNAAQWAYGSYLETESQESEARIWQLRAMHGAREGLDLRGEMLGYCDRIPGFDARTVEGIMLRIAQSSPDAHLRLLQLYIYPGCGAFNLEKASAQIPLLTQCAHLTLVDYLNRAESAHHRVLQPTREAIRSNMAICERELASPPPPGSTVREFMPVRRASLDALAHALATLGE
ncbi:hypothetical protein Acav_0372 [Paracidovorax avenae ATCC 19860]|uniref:Uncharacterized protein n=2 Tax=Paracidovorax avenae TaxID=80867 RepID=F0Q3Q3_PARA1|nr:hypothetical protein Acav_0372 [Paracidovorax avenae ATCC 19860]